MGTRMMSSGASRVWQVLLVLTLGFVVTGYLTYPLYWPVYVCPALMFLPLQAFALSNYSWKERLFTYSDYVYYVIVGGVIGVGGLYVLQGDLVSQLNEKHERVSVKEHLSAIKTDLATSRARLRELESRRPKPDALAECFRLYGQGKTRTNLPDPARELCDQQISDHEEATRLQIDIPIMDGKRARVESRKAELEAERRPKERNLEIQFIWAPTLLVAAITLKLGKTTATLMRRPPSDPMR